MTPTIAAVSVRRNLLAACALFWLAGCVTGQTVTPGEIALQNKVDSLVAQELFARRLDEHASYNVHTDGFVVIRFDASVTFDAYNDVVEWLRARPEIKGVRAEQMGREICPPRR